MPALNEETALASAICNVLNGFSRYGVNGELLIVNDGSSDRTGAIADELAAQHDCIRVLHHDHPHGIGGAFWDGAHHAHGEFVTMIPGDGENDASEIFRYLPLLSEVDIVIPFAYNTTVRPWQRRLLSFVYHQIVYISFSLALNYMNGTVMYRKAILSGISLNSTGFFYQTELLIKTIIGYNYLYAEVPYALRKRHGSESKAITLKSLVSVIIAYLTTLTEVNPFIKTYKTPVPDSVTMQRHSMLSDTK